MESSVLTNETGMLHKRSVRLMGNMFNISILVGDNTTAEECLDAAVAEIQRIERLLTTFNDSSQTNRINNSAGKNPEQVDDEVFNLIKRSIGISRLTQGAFDITYGSIDKSLWNFDQHMTRLPDPETARRMVRLIDYRNIVLDDDRRTVFLRHEGMRLGFGGIGKGYAADRARHVLQQMGIASGIVNASGDLTTWGRQEDGKPWTIGIADPGSRVPYSYLDLSDMSIATSGDYEKYAVIQGKRYSHTINPKTGLPVRGLKSVSIISPMAELSDAMATPVMVMGKIAGLDMINQMKNIACILIDEANHIHTSKNIVLHK